MIISTSTKFRYYVIWETVYLLVKFNGIERSTVKLEDFDSETINFSTSQINIIETLSSRLFDLSIRAYTVIRMLGFQG